ncbi:MAG: hypothetical protein ACRDTR_13910, partial [Rubrobacter sp.]
DRESTLPIGTRVRAGQVVGYAGDTGQGPEVTRGLFPPHLHFGWYDASGGRSALASGAMNPFPLLEWIKGSGGAVTGGTSARYCEAPQGSAPVPAAGGPSWPAPDSPGSRPDLNTGSDDPRPSPVAEKSKARARSTDKARSVDKVQKPDKARKPADAKRPIPERTPQDPKPEPTRSQPDPKPPTKKPPAKPPPAAPSPPGNEPVPPDDPTNDPDDQYKAPEAELGRQEESGPQPARDDRGKEEKAAKRDDGQPTPPKPSEKRPAGDPGKKPQADPEATRPVAAPLDGSPTTEKPGEPETTTAG